MVYKIKTLPGEPIIIDSHGEPMDALGHASFADELAAAVQSIEGTVYRIADLSGIGFSFSTLVYVLAEETRNHKPGSAGDPRIKMVLVAVGKVADLIANASKQEQYGALNLPVFSNCGEALAYVREQIKKGA